MLLVDWRYCGGHCGWSVSIHFLRVKVGKCIVEDRVGVDTDAELMSPSSGFIKGIARELAYNAKEAKNWLIFDGLLLGICASLFYFNSLYLKDALASTNPNAMVAYISQCHLNDFIGGCAFVCYTNILIGLVRPSVRFKRLRAIVLFIAFCGVFWEFVAPAVFVESTSDALDIIAYVFGAMTYWVSASFFASRQALREANA